VSFGSTSVGDAGVAAHGFLEDVGAGEGTSWAFDCSPGWQQQQEEVGWGAAEWQHGLLCYADNTSAIWSSGELWFSTEALLKRRVLLLSMTM
jgi:hypothetical protein